ncbi:MAG: FAD-dependent monooxygenase [Methylobacteriaceae bacterium]|nr:FAD-dependent monooxygenase [Methylobacteriaceae bacterium]
MDKIFNVSDKIAVLIVGAGPVGLTLANDLARRGVTFRIIDMLPEPTRRSRAHGLQSRTLEALDTLDLAQPILAAAQHPQPPFVILSGDKTIARIDFASYLHAPYPYQLVIWQQRIERVLARELERHGRSVERPARLVDFHTDADVVTAHIDLGGGRAEDIRAAWIVGCDGGHSTVRETLGLRMQGTTMPGCFWLGEFDIDWSRSRDALREWWHGDGMASAQFIDFTGKWHTLVEFRADPGEDVDLAKMQAVFRERIGDPHVQLTNPAWMGKLTVNRRMPDHFMVGRAFLAGDAAHVHSGAGGQGMNTGMQDALNLGWKLALASSGSAAPGLLPTYESERLPNAHDVLEASQLYHHVELPRGAVGRWISGSIFKAIQAFGPIGEAAFERVGMLDVNYKSSILSRQESAHATRHTHAGWRLPDVPCRLGGRASSLFDIIRGTRSHLLLFAGPAPNDEKMSKLRAIGAALAPIQEHVRVLYMLASEAHLHGAGLPEQDVIIDGGEHIQHAFGMEEPEAVYVRPDGYIGLRTQDYRQQNLSNYLSSIYARSSLGKCGSADSMSLNESALA